MRAQARVGVEQNYGKNSAPTERFYISQVAAAGQSRNDELEAAKLRQITSTLAGRARNLTRRRAGIRIRF